MSEHKSDLSYLVELVTACEWLLNTEDNTGCSEDLTVVSQQAVDKIGNILNTIEWD